jgi:hypothetical protein
LFPLEQIKSIGIVAMDVSQEDLDNFLTIVESKLRGPFSSLDVAKAATSTRGLSPRQYIQQLIKVFPRMDKVTKLRVLIAMLGLDPSDDTDDLIYNLLQDAQEDRLSEEWVKIIAGISCGIMYQQVEGSHESCRGSEAQTIFEKSGETTLEAIRKHRVCVDSDPLFSPYYYSLLNPDILKEVLPESLHNPHFSVNTDAGILQEDELAERKKIQEGQAGTILRRENALAQESMDSKPKEQDLPTMPGINKMNKSRSKVEPGKSSLFLATKKPIGARPGQSGAQFNALRKKTGTSSDILTKGRRSFPGTIASTGTSSQKFNTNRSKMMMVDLSEVQGLQDEAKQREENTKDARKRKLMDLAASKGLVKKVKQDKVENSGNAKTNGSQVPAGGSTATDSNLAPIDDDLEASKLYFQADSTIGQQGSQAINGDWTQHLEKSNRLSAEDRERIRQFFVDRINPTPDIPIHRLKLHEEKSSEAGTGITVKETLYLELDYNTFGFKKLRKIKRK